MKNIVDFFSYFGLTEPALLELRINLLKDHVDKFVICELNRTHSGVPIKRNLKEKIKEFNLPSKQIEVIELDIPEKIILEDIDYYNCAPIQNSTNINSLEARARERMQKDSLLQVIDSFNDDTIFIHSDADEIIDPRHLGWISPIIRNNLDQIIKIPLVWLQGKAGLRVYNKKTHMPAQWNQSMFICTKHHFKKATPTQIRSNVGSPFPISYLIQDRYVVEDMGWHFSWMGDGNDRKIKRESFPHYDDMLHGVLENSFQGEEINKLHSKNLSEGDIPPSGDTSMYLKNYNTKLLPKEIFQLPRVQTYFSLPNIDNDMIIQGTNQIFNSTSTSSNKLKDFGPIRVINLERRPDKRKFMEDQLKKHNLEYSLFSAIDASKDDIEFLLKDSYAWQVKSPPSRACMLSHICVIKEWLETSNSPYLIVMEDDVDLSYINQWNFTWNEFLNNMPFDWDIIQLAYIPENLFKFNIAKKSLSFQTTACYCIKRHYAKKLIEIYFDSSTNNYKFSQFQHFPGWGDSPENIIFYRGKAYSVPVLLPRYGSEWTDIQSKTTDPFLKDYNKYYPVFVEFWNTMDEHKKEKLFYYNPWDNQYSFEEYQIYFRANPHLLQGHTFSSHPTNP